MELKKCLEQATSRFTPRERIIIYLENILVKKNLINGLKLIASDFKILLPFSEKFEKFYHDNIEKFTTKGMLRQILE